MLKLEPHEVCQYSNGCGYRIESSDGVRLVLCRGCDPDRKNVFVCEFHIEKNKMSEDLIWQRI